MCVYAQAYVHDDAGVQVRGRNWRTELRSSGLAAWPESQESIVLTHEDVLLVQLAVLSKIQI